MTCSCWYRSAILIVLACCAPVLSAQRLSGLYVVVDTAVTARVDDPTVVATRTFRYNDTVRAIRRVNDSIIVQYRDLSYRIPSRSVVKERDFKPVLQTVAVVSDSAELRTEQSTIWVRKGAVLTYIADVDADRIAVSIYGQRATMRRADAVMLRPDPSTATAATTGAGNASADQRPFRVRPGFSLGFAAPLSDVEYLKGGFTWAGTIDLRLSSNNLFITLGYSATNISLYTGVGLQGTATLGMVHAGIIGGLTSDPDVVIPYTSINIGILTDDGDIMIAGGIGLEAYASPKAVLFAEVMPTFHVDSGTFFWLPVRFGLKFGL